MLDPYKIVSKKQSKSKRVMWFPRGVEVNRTSTMELFCENSLRLKAPS